jgi:hypothetical protein
MNAVGNPVIYKMTRKDFTFNQINNNGGFIQLQFNGSDITTSLPVGHTIYIQSTNGVYDLFGTITASTFSTNTLVTVDQAYISAAIGGGFVNNDDLRPLYRVEVEVYNSDDELLTESPFVYSPNSKGALTIDIAVILRAQLSPVNALNLTGSTEVFDDTSVYVGFYIKYREVWTGSAESQTSGIANQFVAVLGAKQIPSTYGGNMWDNGIIAESVPVNDAGGFGTSWANETDAGQSWTIGSTMDVSLTAGQESKITSRSVTFPDVRTKMRFQMLIDIATTLLPALRLYINGAIVHTELNIPVGSANVVDVEIDTTDQIVSIGIEADNTSGAGTSGLSITDVYLVGGYKPFLTKLDKFVMWRGWPSLLSALYINTGSTYLDIGGDTTTPAGASDTIGAFDLTQILTDQTVEETYAVIRENVDNFTNSLVLPVKLKDPCANPVMLMARNSLGGTLQWMFDVNQEYTFDYGNGRKAKRLVLTTVNLTINEWESLQDFITLGEVYRENIVEFTSTTDATSRRIGQQVYVLNQDGTKIGVIALPTRNTTRTKQIRHIFELEIEYPEEFSV